MRLLELDYYMYLEQGSTSAVVECWPLTVIDMGPNSWPVLGLDSNEDQAPVAHMVTVVGGREDRHDLVLGMVFDLVVFAVADTEVVAGTEPDPAVLVVVHIHSPCLH